MPLTNPDYTKNKSHGDNCNKSNYNISNKVGSKKQKSDNLEGPK